MAFSEVEKARDVRVRVNDNGCNKDFLPSGFEIVWATSGATLDLLG